MAAAAIPIVVNVASKVAGVLLAGHTARLKGATTENQAVDQVVPAFDADLLQIQQSYKAGTTSPSQAVAALQQVAAQTKQYLQQQVGKPGTKWTDSVGMAGKCNSDCTVGCCVWYGDLGPAVGLSIVALGGPSIGWAQGDPRLSGTTVTVPKVYSSKYSAYTRASYALDWSAPPASPATVLSGVAGTLASALGLSHTTTSSTSTPLTATVSASASPVTKLLLYGLLALGVVFAAIFAWKK